MEVDDLAPVRRRDRTGLAELLATDLCGLDLVARMVDGSESPSTATWWRWDHPGRHQGPLGLGEGATEHATVVGDLLAGLRDRG